MQTATIVQSTSVKMWITCLVFLSGEDDGVIDVERLQQTDPQRGTSGLGDVLAGIQIEQFALQHVAGVVADVKDLRTVADLVETGDRCRIDTVRLFPGDDSGQRFGEDTGRIDFGLGAGRQHRAAQQESRYRGKRFDHGCFH